MSVAQKPTVQVAFNSVCSNKVAVISSTRMIVSVPQSPLPVDKPNYGEGAVTLTFQNLDEAGIPIPGETASFAGFSYQRPQLSNEGIITRVTRYVLRQLRLQIIANVSLTNNTDFDTNADNMQQVTELASLPGLALIGPELTENMFYTANVGFSTTDIFGDVTRFRAPYTVDARYTIVGVSNSMLELLNLMTVTQQFFERNKYLIVPVDPSNLSLGTISYELDMVEGDDMKVFGSPNESNIRAFSGNILVRGVDIGGVAGFASDTAEDRNRPVTELCSGLVIEQIPPESN
jgi:hypothetical protein